MKIFLLVVTILLLINRIRTTPAMLSKNITYKNLNKTISDLKERKYNKEQMETLTGTVALFVLAMFVFNTIYYSIIASMFSDNTVVLLLSVLQIVLSFDFVASLKTLPSIMRYDIEGYKFKRCTNLLNIVIDYVYYPMIIFLLLK